MRKREYARNRYYEQQSFRNALSAEIVKLQEESQEIQKELTALEDKHESLSCREDELKSVYRVLRMENRTLKNRLAASGRAVVEAK